MRGRKCFIASVFVVSILALSGMLFAQRVIDLDKVWGDMRVLGGSADDWSGYAVAYGDINGDGFMDIIIGAYYADPGVPQRSSAGETYVVFGSSSPPSTLDLNSQSANITVYGAVANDWSGRAVASGDVNGDGYDDIIIGAPNADLPGGRDSVGKTHIIFGSSSPPSTIDLSTTSADITINGDDDYDYSGWAVASEDVNNDNYDDIIIGAPYADPTGGSDAGETYVIFGSSFPSPPYTIDLSTTQADLTIYGDDAGDNSGYTVASGNVNGDVYNDIIIGAPYADPGTTPRIDAGKTYVIFGDSFYPPYTINLDTMQAPVTVYGDDEYDYSGWAVASGDVNGNGYDNLIIGAIGADPGGRSNAGESYVIFGSGFPSPPYIIDLNSVAAGITVYGNYADGLSGYAVSSGDINGDGKDDVIIGAYLADPGLGFNAGETYVILGLTLPPSTIDLSTQSANITVCGDDPGDNSGFALASGDVNGDGYYDLIIGAYYADPTGGADAGETYLITGGGAIVAAQGLGGASWVKEFSPLGRISKKFRVFGPPNAQGEVHLAVGDFDGDKFDEIVAGQGEGGASWVKLFEMDGTLIRKFRAFGPPNAQGEVHLAIGNFDANPIDKEIAVAQGEGGQSWVKLFRANGTLIWKFTAFGPPNAQGEVHLAACDLENSDGIDEIVAGMGEGGNSLVKIFDNMGSLIRSFQAFSATDNPGGEVHLAVGNFDTDAAWEIAVGTGYNGGDLVKLFEKDGTFISQFTVFHAGANTNGEVQITAADMDNDGIWEIICGHGEGGESRVTVFKADGTRIRSFRAFGTANTQGEVHLGKSNY